MSQTSQNLAAVAAVARGLDDLVHEVAFVGGVVTALYLDDPGASDVRATDDVSNKWYGEAMPHRVQASVEPGLFVSIFPVPYFLATKLEAFTGRGKSDWLASHDLEDIITVLDGCTTVERSLMATSGELHRYLVAAFERLLSQTSKTEIFLARLPPDPGSQKRAGRLQAMLERLTAYSPKETQSLTQRILPRGRLPN